MNLTKRIILTTVTERILIFHLCGRQSKSCIRCGSELMLGGPSIAQLTGVSMQTIFRWVECEQVHFINGSDGLLICLPSLLIKNSGIVDR
jgi:hypothetical protein